MAMVFFLFVFFIFNISDFADNLKHNLCPRDAEGAGCKILQRVEFPTASYSRIASDIFIACVFIRQGCRALFVHVTVSQELGL